MVQRDLLTRYVGPEVGAVALLGVGLVAGLLGALGALAAPTGLGPAGWALGLTCGVTGNLWLAAGLVHSGRTRLGPADLVTLARATLACGVAALVADAFARPTQVPWLVGLAAITVSLDWVDGRVARRTGTVTSLGARFDMEVDAFLILVLGVHVAQDFGVWVLAIGLARYALLAAGWMVPWLSRPAPPRHWCKVVAALQGIVLIVAAADVLPPSVASGLLVLALALLAESFGREVVWLARTRQPLSPAT